MATEEFLDAFIVGGGPVEECDFCGNTFYSTTDLDEEELKYYEERGEKSPLKFHPEPYDSIEFYVIDNRRYVYGCSCNALDKYEQFIWEHRERILRYLNSRSQIEHDRAVVEKARVDAAVELHKNAKNVAEALAAANRVLNNTKASYT